MSLPSAITAALRVAGLDPDWVADLVRASIDEDLVGGDGVHGGPRGGWPQDVTGTATVSERQQAQAHVVPRAAGVVAGIPVAAAVFAVVGEPDVHTEAHVSDGAAVRPGDRVLSVSGPARALLLGERTALNLLGRASGVATTTRRWVDAVQGTGTAIRDTRKTTPLLRALEKYAVRCGGGSNHRFSLSDAALIKDNHVASAGGVVAAIHAVRRYAPELPSEVEDESLDEARAAASAGADLILLDNFDVPTTRAAVELLDGRCRIEASGGLTLQRAREYAEAGVDYLAVGALTHSAPALDLGLDFEPSAIG